MTDFGPFAGPFTQGHLCAVRPMNQQFADSYAASSYAAMLLQKHGLVSAGDPFLGASRSSSPYMQPQDANNATGVLDPSIMQLPPAAVSAAAGAAVPVGTIAQQQLISHRSPSCGDSPCSHSSDDVHEPAAANQICTGMFVGMPCHSYGSPSPGSAAEAPAVVSAAAVPSAHAAAAHSNSPVTGALSASAAAACAPMHAPSVPAACANSSKSWLYQLVTCPYLFKPCTQCSATHTGREVLITYFDPDDASRGYCTYCPERASKPRLLQIRRSTYHEVVKAADISRLTDVSGIQHYVINGAKVMFLRPRPQPRPPKGVVAPARCAVDGRQLMDAHSNYCSLRCKLEIEDTVFATHYPSALEEMEAAAAAAEGDSEAGLAGTYHRQGGHEGRRVVVPSSKRAALQAPAAAEQADEGSSEEADLADGKWGARAKRQRNLPSKYANTVLGGSAPYQAAGASSAPRSAVQQHKGDSKVIQPGSRDDMLIAQGEDGMMVAVGIQPAVSGGTAGTLSLAGLGVLADMGKGMLQQRLVAASPCASEDSARSTTCNQRWQHRRKLVQPCRAPLQ